MCLQAVEVPCLTSVKRYDGVPLASWVSELRLCGKVKSKDVAVAKASLNRAIQSLGLHAKRDDLTMARVKLR